MKNLKKMIVLLVIAPLMIFSLIGCQKDNNGTVSVGLVWGSYTNASFNFFDFLFPQAKAATSNVKMCFKRLRFKKADTDSADVTTDEDNIDFDLGEVDLSEAGTLLGQVQLPEGVYVRLEFDLENSCASGKSIQFTNANGVLNHSETARITIKFTGTFTADSDGTLSLATQQIMDQLNTYASGSVRDHVQNASGTL